MDWRKSSFCAANECIEVASWRKSSHSSGGSCVEAGHGPGVIGVRDSTLNESPVLEFPAAKWAAFTASLKARLPA
jgi:hypothetical protein